MSALAANIFSCLCYFEQGTYEMGSVVMVIETGTETAVFLQKPNRTETAVLCLCIDGSVMKWNSSGVLNVNSSCKSSRPLISPVRVIVGIKGEIAGGGGPAPRRLTN